MYSINVILSFAGQNKNRYLIGYLIWRVLIGLHKEISLHFQIPGHTRCLIDAGFACFKRTYRYIYYHFVTQNIFVQVDPAILSLNNPLFIYNFTNTYFYVYSLDIQENFVNNQKFVCVRITKNTYTNTLLLCQHSFCLLQI